MLGGDVAVELRRPANAKEMAFFAAHGRVSASASMQAMAFALKEGRQDQRQLVNIKAVDKAWPLFGAPKYSNPLRGADAVACEDDGICGAAAEQSLLDRLKIKRGDLMRVGDATLRLITVLESEPDRISAGFSLGPHVLVSEAALAKMNLIQPGSLVEYTYRVAFRPGSSTSIESFKADADKTFHDDGWRIRDRNDAAPGIRRFVEQVTMFLTLVGLVALGVGGVGAGQAILAFLDRKRADIATLKSLGSTGGYVFGVMLLVAWWTIYRRPTEKPQVSPSELAYIQQDNDDQAGKVGWFFYYGATGFFYGNTQFIGYNARQGSFTQSRRAMKKDMIQRLATHIGCLDKYAQVLDKFGLPGKILYGLRPNGIFILPLLRR